MPQPLNLHEHAPAPLLSAPTTLEDAAFRAYLDAVCAPVQALAPPEWLADLRAELACHLACTAEAYEELGESREQAARSACRSLGDPAELGRKWERFWLEKQPEPFKRTFQLAMVRFGAAALAAPPLILFSWWNLFRNLSPVATHFADLLTFFTILLLPIVVGAAFAHRSRGRRVLGAAAAMLVVTAVSGLLALLPGEDPGGLRTVGWQLYMLYWLPLGSAAAGITGLARARRERRRLQRGS